VDIVVQPGSNNAPEPGDTLNWADLQDARVPKGAKAIRIGVRLMLDTAGGVAAGIKLAAMSESLANVRAWVVEGRVQNGPNIQTFSNETVVMLNHEKKFRMTGQVNNIASAHRVFGMIFLLGYYL
jgi:hypothetical protein